LQFYATWIHFASIYNKPHLVPKQTFARIDFLWQGGRLVDGKGTHYVKISTKKIDKNNFTAYTRMANCAENT